MKQITYILILLLTSGCTFSSNSSEQTIRKLESEGKPYFEHLVATKQYESLLDKIENGDEALIRGSSILTQWTDASTSLSLRYALSRAITRNPDAVIRLIPEFFTISDLCTIPYIEDTVEVEFKHVNESISALERSTKLTNVHIQCLSIYKKFREDITKSSSGR